MNRNRCRAALVASIWFAIASVSHGAEATAPVGVVSHVKVLSDKVPDVSSLEAWKKSVIKPGMTDEQKAIAIWTTVVAFRHQDAPPLEFLTQDPCVHDPIKSFNVYGYNQCCCASASVEALARYIGLESRGWGITAHSVPEIKYNGAWHMFDASLVNYFPTPGGVAGVEQVSGDIETFYKQHPELRNDNDKLYKFMRGEGWRKGPGVVACSPFYDGNGWLPAATHGWYSSMQEFGSASKNFQYEYGAPLGYEVNIQLRKGERLTRNWSNKGMHVNQLEGAGCSTAKNFIGKEDLRYAPKFGDLAPGRVGNGELMWDVPVSDAALADAAIKFENLKASAKGLALADVAKPATLVLRMPSSYVYLGGDITVDAKIGAGGGISIDFSDNNGLDWKPVAKVTATGTQKIDLKALVYRRYDYRLRFELKGAGTEIGALKIRNDIQHSQRPLPALDAGDNTITFSAEPAEGTITAQGNINAEHKGKNLQFADFHPQLEGFAKDAPGLLVGSTGKATVTLPIETPGDLTRLRIGAHYRARDARDGFDVSASYDGGKTFVKIGQLSGPFAGMSTYLTGSDVPTGVRSALLRLVGEQRNTTMLLDLRLSADYKEPRGGFAPVRVTYAWEENGQAKEDVHIARAASEIYKIRCEAKPVMKSIVLERAD